MAHITFQAFEAEALKRNFHEVVERKWAPEAAAAAHTHPFDADALVVQGEMWLTVDDVVRHIRSGETFALDAKVVHSERYGVRRRHLLGCTAQCARQSRRVIWQIGIQPARAVQQHMLALARLPTNWKRTSPALLRRTTQVNRDG